MLARPLLLLCCAKRKTKIKKKNEGLRIFVYYYSSIKLSLAARATRSLCTFLCRPLKHKETKQSFNHFAEKMLVLGYFFQILEGEKNVTEEQYFLSFYCHT